MIIFSISPFLTGYREAVGTSFHLRDSYRASWRNVAERFAEVAPEYVVGSRFPLASNGSRPAYESSSREGFTTRSEIAVFDLAVPDTVVGTPPDQVIPDRLRLSLYAHGVGLFEVLWSGVAADDLGEMSARLPELHECVLAAIAARITAVVEVVATLASAAGIEQDGRAKPTAIDPMWSSGGLVVGTESLTDRQARAWFGEQGLDDKDIDGFCAGESDAIASWMRYAYRIELDEGTDILDDPMVRSMRYCQYIFAAADDADNDLSEALGRSYDKVGRHEVARVRAQLNAAANRIRVVDLEHSGLLKTISPGERSLIVGTLESWEFDDLVVQPGLNKAAAAQDRLAELSARNTRTAALITEVILLGIALTSLFATVMALMQYGRLMVSDPTYSSYAQESGSFLDYLSGVSTDGMLVVTLVLCTVLAVVYVVVKIRNR